MYITNKNKNKIFAGISIIVLLLSFLYILYYSFKENKPTYYGISELNTEQVGEYISTCGIISSIKERPKVTFLEITNYNKTINVVDFSKKRKYLKGEFICINGTLKLYKGKVEIVIE